MHVGPDVVEVSVEVLGGECDKLADLAKEVICIERIGETDKEATSTEARFVDGEHLGKARRKVPIAGAKEDGG